MWMPQLISRWRKHVGKFRISDALVDPTAVQTTLDLPRDLDTVINRDMAADIDTDGPQLGCLDIVLSQNLSKFELRWDHLLTLKKIQKGQECLLLLLDEKPEMDDPAVNMILSLWDAKVVAALLEFREVKITDEVIKTVAGNMRSGAQVMELLLQREAEMMELMN